MRLAPAPHRWDTLPKFLGDDKPLGIYVRRTKWCSHHEMGKRGMNNFHGSLGFYERMG